MAHPNTKHQPYDAVAALIRHINQRNREIARQKHLLDRLKALSKKYNVERSLPKKDVDSIKSNIYNIMKKWS
jgi:hypothetical protein